MKFLMWAGVAMIAGCNGPAFALGPDPQPQQRLMAIFAHPDDELPVAPLLARYAREGRIVQIIYATRGDLSAPQTELRPGPEIAALRTREARCASLALGLSEPLFMEFGDGTLGNRRQPGQDISAKLSQSVAALLASYQPDVILTWGPEGGYGHPDHRMVSAVVTELVQQSVPGTPRTLVYPGMPNGTIPDVPEAKTIGWITSDPALLLVKVAYSQQDLEATKNAFLCHASQYPAPLLETAPLLFDSAIWRGTVHLRGAFERMEGDDLFALDRAK